jgi:hypothetical protein
MAQDSFLNILAMLHICNYYAYVTRGQVDYDLCSKCPISDCLISEFQEIHTPEEELTTDLAICAYSSV